MDLLLTWLYLWLDSLMTNSLFSWTHPIHYGLVEGHAIRNKTNANKAVMAITAIHKWVLTGTPLLNKLSDVHVYFQCKSLYLLRSFEWVYSTICEIRLNILLCC
jgi:SNF2-related domain